MSYYDKKIIKGSHKKDDYSKDDYCKKDHHCEEDRYEKHDWKDECEDEEVAGVVTTGNLANFSVTAGASIPLPLTTPVLLTEGVKVNPTGGLIVQEDGEYLVSLSVGVVSTGVTGSISVFADSRFLGNAGPVNTVGLANFAAIVYLKRGAVVQAVANGVIGTSLLSQATLSVAKLED
ncbi:hypothetical protein GOICGAJE_03853 [Bacillus sp. MB95]|nr:hypothetical protein [Bacillus sp. MB95]